MIGQLETRRCRLDFRAVDGGAELGGVAISYNVVSQVAPGLMERFLPGSFGNVDKLDVILNVQHNRERPIARTGPDSGLVLVDSQDALRVTALLDTETTDGADAVRLLTRQILRGLSVEFVAIRQAFVAGVREIREARLMGLGLVDRPAHEGSVAELRELVDQCAASGSPDGPAVLWWML